AEDHVADGSVPVVDVGVGAAQGRGAHADEDVRGAAGRRLDLRPLERAGLRRHLAYGLHRDLAWRCAGTTGRTRPAIPAAVESGIIEGARAAGNAGGEATSIGPAPGGRSPVSEPPGQHQADVPAVLRQRLLDVVLGRRVL